MSKKKKRRELRRIRPEDLQQGPLRHKNGLSPVLEERARDLYSEVGKFVYPTFEQWELGFMRDEHPWREILVWENIARAFHLYVAKHPEAANNEDVVASLVLVSTGDVSESETDFGKEIRTLYMEAYKKRWLPPPGEPFEFPADGGIVLQYEDVVDKWNGAIHPNLRRSVDPRRILADADLILGMAPMSESQFCIYGRDRLEGERVPEGLKVVVVCLDLDNKKKRELETICFVVQQIKGRYDFGTFRESD